MLVKSHICTCRNVWGAAEAAADLGAPRGLLTSTSCGAASAADTLTVVQLELGGFINL